MVTFNHIPAAWYTHSKYHCNKTELKSSVFGTCAPTCGSQFEQRHGTGLGLGLILALTLNLTQSS